MVRWLGGCSAALSPALGVLAADAALRDCGLGRRLGLGPALPADVARAASTALVAGFAPLAPGLCLALGAPGHVTLRGALGHGGVALAERLFGASFAVGLGLSAAVYVAVLWGGSGAPSGGQPDSLLEAM